MMKERSRFIKTTLAVGATVAVSLLSGAAIAYEMLPLGDGRISAAPKARYLFSCQQQFNPYAPGSHVKGPWIVGTMWYPDRKPHVEGAVAWPSASITVSVESAGRIVRANNLPTHLTGVFPVARGTKAHEYDRNPNVIAQQNILLTLPAQPNLASEATCVPMGIIGFALTGVALFSAVDARGEDASAHEVQDRCNGHPERGGQYHYHNASPCMADTKTQPDGHSDLVGYALDGFGLFGPHGENGTTLTSGDLGACHGHTHDILWDGSRIQLFHYHLTPDYPYTVGCFRGKPVSVATARPAPQGSGRVPLSIAAERLGVSRRALVDALGPPPPNFARAARTLGRSENAIRSTLQRSRR
jgi:hypothetical protein